MESSNLMKVAAAFAGGVVVALGSALLYVHSNDVQHQPVAQASQVAPRQVAASTPAVNTSAPIDPAPAEPAVSDTAERHDEPAVQPHRPVHRRKSASPKPVAVSNQTPAPQPSTAADNVPPPVPAPTPAESSAPPRAVNDDQYQGPQPAVGAAANSTPAPPPQQPHAVTLDAGTSIFIRLNETLSTDHNYSGDTFRATLEQPIVRDGFIIADRGSKVLGQVVEAERAGRVRGTAVLNLQLTEINTTDGQQVRISTDSFDKQGPKSTKQDAAKIAGGAALGAIIGAIGGGGKGAAIGAGVGGAAGTGTVLATRGKEAVIPSETRLQFRLANPVTITEKLNN